MRPLDRVLIVLAMLLFGQALFRTIVEKWDEFGGIPRRPPVSAPAPPPRDAPAKRQPPPGYPALPAIGQFDAVVNVSPAPPRRPDQRSTGTAFAVGRDGAWMTAKHVVDGCGRVFVRNGQNWERAAVAFEDAETDTAIIGARGGVPMLPVTAGPFGLGEDGFAFGFAGQGGPSAIHAVLLGRARAVQSGRFAGSTPVLAWAERDWQPPGERWIGGMSGGPLTTAEGAVAGIMSVASQRRGRIYTVAPEVIARVMRDRLYAFVPPGAAPVAATGENFDGVRSVLMGRRSVVQVLCAG